MIVNRLRSHNSAHEAAWLLIPFVFVLLAGVYFTARFGGRWAESDSTTFASVIRSTASSGQLVPSGGAIYPNGYSFQVISTFILATTGLSVAALQQIIYPLLAALVVLPAWVLYRELCGSGRAATLTTVLLFTQPEFLFVVLRSSHEKFTRSFMLLCLFLLVRSFKLRHRPWAFTAHVALFYLVAFAFIASNNLLAHSFIFALATALVLGLVLDRIRRTRDHSRAASLRRLLMATVICLGLVYLFAFYIYTPAAHDIAVVKDSWERARALFVDSQPGSDKEPTTFNAYAYISFGWINLPVYFMVSIGNWIVLASSFAIWAWQGVRWLLRGKEPATQGTWLLWLFYAAFVFQGAGSVISDYSGAIGNLQHRLYPSFSLVAVAVVGAALGQWQPRRFRLVIQSVLTAVVACIAVLSILKASNEPLLSNKWTFYRSDEMIALDWSDAHLRSAEIGSAYDERLAVGFQTTRGISVNDNSISSFDPEYQRLFLLSTVSRLRSSRLRAPLPNPPDAQIIYDNGESELYRVRPQTPYQK